MTLTLDALTVVLGGQTRCGPLDLKVPSGSTVAVVGKNGAGKTVLLDALSGRHAFAGSAVLDVGASTIDLSTGACTVAERAAAVASLAQRPPVADAFAVRQRIAHGLFGQRKTLDDAAQARAVVECAEALDVHAFLARPLATLSVGQQKRVHLARVLVHPEASLILLDEPFAGLDIAQHTRVMDALSARAKAGTCVVFSTHHLARARQADVVLGLVDGAVAFGPCAPAEVSPDAMLALFD